MGGASCFSPPAAPGPPRYSHFVTPGWRDDPSLCAAPPGALARPERAGDRVPGRREGGEADLEVLTGKRARHRPESRRAVKSEELSWRGGAVRGHLSLARVEARLPHRPRVTMAASSSSARASVHEWIAEDACAPLRSRGSSSAPPYPPPPPPPPPPPSAPAPPPPSAPMGA